MIECWCKICGKKLKSKREYITQQDTCDECFLKMKYCEKRINITKNDLIISMIIGIILGVIATTIVFMYE